MRVSVLIPIHNAEPYLRETLNAVASQSLPASEVIAVDDGSTDNSRAILSASSLDVTLIAHQVPLGASASRNRAFDVSTGTHVVFLDADDIVNSTHLESLVDNVARGGRRSIAFGRWARFTEHYQAAAFPQRPTERDMGGVDWLVTDWSNAQPMMQCGMFLIPRCLIEAYGGWDQRLSLIDDFEFFSRMIAASDSMIFAPRARLYYRSGVAGSLSSRKNRHAAESQFLSLMMGIGHLLAAEDSARTRGVCANLLKQFEYEHFPAHADLREQVNLRITELGGADNAPTGPPNFHRLRRVIGWRTARRVQLLTERLKLNSAARRMIVRKIGTGRH